ncbi:hypothetical protein NHX12_005263 [Muraenolepis orangiensis]|uniref:Uncharacterized protein n=1 Tax=Muraenolepis orangiensis TaxID=630683 RepID=A0A9Q0DTM9_9TELE|nr:hypothetical protein NHX12_005263 [Muraenolepis orangiensis]
MPLGFGILEQNKRSFHRSGYAWFPPLAPCFESHVSLEFITEQVDGLLLYSSPLAQLLPWDKEDIMAIGEVHPGPVCRSDGDGDGGAWQLADHRRPFAL